jgi:hypothetical protein
MKVTVTRLRERGKRRSDHQIGADPGTVGDMRLATVAGVKELSLAALGDEQQRKPIIPNLYMAEIQNLHDDGMLYIGYEKGPDGAGYVQEWRAILYTGGKHG